MAERTALMNRIRGLLGEYGVVIACCPSFLRRELSGVLEDAENGLTTVARQLIAYLREHLKLLEERISEVNRVIEQLGEQVEAVRRLKTVPGIGVLTATALIAAAGDGKVFRNGRQMAAWLGLVPRQHSSGGKNRLLGISKRGDKYLRTLLVHGARSIMMYAERQRRPEQQWLNDLRQRRGKHRACVAQANKTARIAWAIMTGDSVYRVSTASA